MGGQKRRQAPARPRAAHRSPAVVAIPGGADPRPVERAGMGWASDRTVSDRPTRACTSWRCAGRRKAPWWPRRGPAAARGARAKDTSVSVITFGKQLAERTGRPVLLDTRRPAGHLVRPEERLHLGSRQRVTRGSTCTWTSSTPSMPRWPAPGQRSRGGVVAQGESDVPLMTGPDYRTKLDSLIDDLRQRYGQQLPFVWARWRPRNWIAPIATVRPSTPCMPIRPAAADRTAFVRRLRGALNSETDRHFNAFGLRRSGGRCGRPTARCVPARN